MRILIFIAIIAFGGCKVTSEEKGPSSIDVSDVQAFDLINEGDTLSSRALSVLNDESTILGGSHGKLIRIETKSGVEFIKALEMEDAQLRSMATMNNEIYYINAGSPGLMHRYNPQTEAIHRGMYQDNDSLAFYNTMKGWDNKNGIVTGDQQDGCLTILTTNDGGESWKRVPCVNLPDFEEGEANFAASNTCIDVVGDNAWIVTGGKKARVLHTSNKGRTWTAYDTPIVQGQQMTGIFSVDFWDENLGVIFGGDWENKGQNTGNKAITKDGGKTWQLIADGDGPGYRSCVKFHPKGNGQVIIACGSEGVEYSMDQGQTWDKLINGGYYTMDFSPSGDVLWLAGRGKAARVNLTLK